MFHRVKSEPDRQQSSFTKPNEPAATSPAEPQANALAAVKSAESKPVVAPIASASTPTQAPTPFTSSPDVKQSQPVQKKDVTMSDANENQNKDDAAQVKAVDIPSSAYGTQPARTPYQGNTFYGVQPAAAASPLASSASNKEERRLVIGYGITMSGEIEHCDTLLVEGTIEAALKGAKMLEISESGTFYGTVEIDEANISGRFEGDLTVNGRLKVSASGIIAGSISYKELQIEAGAIIDGKLTPLKEGAVSASQKPSARKDKPKEVAASAKTKEVKEQQAANSDEGELFSAKVSAAE